jgi:tRNA modification GTPase
MNYSFDYLSKKDDTIAAISTPLGTGGLGIVRISGKNAVSIADRIFEGKVLPSQAESHTLTFGKIVDVNTKEKIDEVFLTVMKTPRSYTKEDMVEITSHGSSFILYKILQQALDGGTRLAFPGEFTFRAFLNGRIDLAQAEAVAEVIKAKTDLSLKVALSHLEGSLSEKLNSFRDRLVEILANLEVQIDFPEEDLEPKDGEIILAELKNIENELSFFLSTYDEGKILKDGLRVVIVGKPNVGKSSLLNAFLKEERAIVTPIPGTTRDVISEEANFKGIPVRLVDTAGFRVSKDTIELEGIKRTKLEINRADMILWVVDASQKLDQDELDLENQIKDYKHLVVLNKIDLASPENISELEKNLKEKVIRKICALKQEGINKLIDTIACTAITIDRDSSGDVILTNLRHKDCLTRAKDAVLKARKSWEEKMSLEFVALDLRIALDSIGEIVGKTVTEDILNKIFSDFCVGK